MRVRVQVGGLCNPPSSPVEQSFFLFVRCWMVGWITFWWYAARDFKILGLKLKKPLQLIANSTLQIRSEIETTAAINFETNVKQKYDHHEETYSDCFICYVEWVLRSCSHLWWHRPDEDRHPEPRRRREVHDSDSSQIW